MTTTYSSGLLQLSFTSGNVNVVNGSGDLSVTGTYYISIQGRNLVGLNLNSDLVPVTLTTTSTLTITLPTLESGETWSSIVISASTTNDLSTLTQVMVVNSVDFSSPVILTSEELFKLTTSERTVATPASLPAVPIQGLIRYVTSLNYYYEYDEYSVAIVDDLTVLSATTGRWIRVGSISTYITDTTDVDGCDQDVRTPDLIVNAPTYTCDGSKGKGVIFWLRNEFSTIIPSGTRISCTVRLFEEDKSQLFDSLLILELLGYVNLTTGELDTSVSSGEVVYQPKQQWLTLPEDLDIGYAAVVSVSPQFTVSDLDNNIPYLANLTTYLTFAPTSGIYTPGVFGNLIYDEWDKWRIYPGNGLSIIKGKGSGIVNNYELNDIASETITGLTSNTANQYIFLTSNGTSFASTTSSFVSAVKRCVVSTVNGIGIPISYGSVNLDNTKRLSVTVNYPTNIRSNYPDTLVAGSNNGEFNATSVIIYIKDGINDVYVTEVAITPVSVSDNYTLNYSDFTLSSLAAPSTNYGLYTPLSVTLTTTVTSSTFPTDSYEVFVAFKYTGVVTVIDHSVSELYEITSTIEELFTTKATVWLSGNGVPDNGDGENGNYYLNYDNADIYKKVNDIWVLDGNIAVTTPSFGTIAISGEDSVVADQTNDTLNLIAGTGITLTTNATTDSITIESTAANNTFSTIAVSGQSNIVADGSADTLTIAAGAGITLTTNASTDTLTITSSAANNTFSTFAVSGQSDVVADGTSDTLTLVAGTGITITTNATTDSITFNSSGVSATVDVGTVTPLNPDQSPTVVNSGTTSAAILDFGLPNAPTTTIGSVSTLSPGASATVTNTGSNGNVILNFGIPAGATGSMSAASGFILTPVGTPITTSTSEVGFYVDTSDNLLKTRLASNGAISLVGSTQDTVFLRPISTPSTPSTAKGVFLDSVDGLLKLRDISDGAVLTFASINRQQTFTKTQGVSVISNSGSGTVTLDGSTTNIFSYTLTGNVTDLTMSNIQVGATYIIYLIQDATGGRTVVLNSIFKRLVGDSSTINTTANKINILTGIARSSSAITLFPIAVEV